MEVAEALRALAADTQPAQDLTQVAHRLIDHDDPKVAGSELWAVSRALLSLGHAANWASAIEAADTGATASQNASRLIASKALGTEHESVWSTAVVQALNILVGLSDLADISLAAAALQRAPLVFPATDLLVPRPSDPPPTPRSDPVDPPTVNIHFTLNGKQVSWPMALQAGVSYRLGASATINKWSERIANLRIDWKCEAPESILERTSFSILPEGTSTASGYLHARAEIPPDQGVDLIPLATLVTIDGDEHDAQVVGQRSLRIATFAPATIGAGLPMVSQRIVELLAELDSRIPTLPRPDRLDLLHILDATSRFAALAIENKSLNVVGEKGFQEELKKAFVMDPRIGRRIQEGGELGGGETDLVLERIVNELKVSPTRIDFNSAQRFIGQTTQYASSGDCPVSVLTVLDQSEKTEPPGIQSNYMKWVFPPTHTTGSRRIPSMVAVVIIPVGFPVPSQWSRFSGHKR